MRHPRVALAYVALLQLVSASSAFAHEEEAGGLRATRVLVSPARPQELMVATTFGLLVSGDEGRTWDWICEEAMGGHPEAVVLQGNSLLSWRAGALFASTDAACTWSAPRVTPEAELLVELGEAMVLARSGTTGRVGLFMPVVGGGVSLNGPFFVGEPDDVLLSQGASTTTPAVRYLSGIRPQGNAPLLARSEDGGGSWSVHDVKASVGEQVVLILGVDPQEARTVFLLVADPAAQTEKLAVSRDGGQTVQVVLQLPRGLTSFLRLESGAWLVGDVLAGLSMSHDGGATFSPWELPFGPEHLAEVGGRVYAVASDPAVGLQVSTDGASTWTPALRFTDVRGPKACVASTCAGAWTRVREALVQQAPPATPVRGPSKKSGGCNGTSGTDDGAAPFAWALLCLLVWVPRRAVRRV